MPFSLHVDPRFTGDIAAIAKAAERWNSAERSGDGFFLYPPLAYHTFSVYLLYLARPMVPKLLDKPIFGLEARYNWLASADVFRNLFVLKTWYLLLDSAVAFLLWQMLRDRPPRVRRVALIAWVLNPLVLYSAYFHGQFDLVPVFFVVLSLFVARKGQPMWAAFWMGIGACYKNFPFFFLLPLVLILARTWLDRSKMLVVGTLPYILLFIPSIGEYGSLGTHLSGRFFRAGVELGSGSQIYFFFIFYAVLLWYLYHRRAHALEDLWRVCFSILLVYYQFSEFDLHYWVWAVPFAIIYWVERPEEATPFYLVILACLLIVSAPTPLARFLAPLSPRFFLRLPSLAEALNRYLPMLFITNIVRSLLAGTCFYLAWRLLRDMPASRGQRLQAAPDPATVL
jgi:hypothetical protein